MEDEDESCPLKVIHQGDSVTIIFNAKKWNLADSLTVEDVGYHADRHEVEVSPYLIDAFKRLASDLWPNARPNTMYNSFHRSNKRKMAKQKRELDGYEGPS